MALGIYAIIVCSIIGTIFWGLPGLIIGILIGIIIGRLLPWT